MRIPIRRPAVVLALTILWVALWDDVTWANVLSGVLVAILVISVARLDRVAFKGTNFHLLYAVWYVVRLGFQLLQASIRLAWEILTPAMGTHTGIVAVPMRGGTDDVVTLVANSITLTPGTLTVDVERGEEETTLYVHGMYTRDEDAVRRDVLRLEALALRAFGSNEEAAMAQADLDQLDRSIRARGKEPS